MEIKKKVCRGNGKAKGIGCGELVSHRKFGLGLSCKCYQNWLFSTEEGKAERERKTISAKKKVKADSDREFKKAHKSIASYIQDVRFYYHKYIRLRDANLPCISCGSNSELVDAGHYKKAELFRGTIFDEINTNGQCRKCNRFLNGNESAYREGLIKKYGESEVLALEKRANDLRAYKWTREELEEIKQKYKDKYKELL